MRIVEIHIENDIALARSAVRALAEKLGFSVVDKTRIATAATEVARNTLIHGGGGTMEIEPLEDGTALGIRCVFKDQGPGIADIDQILHDGAGTAGCFGQGLSATRRLMDSLRIESQPGDTCVEIIKWMRSR